MYFRLIFPVESLADHVLRERPFLDPAVGGLFLVGTGRTLGDPQDLRQSPPSGGTLVECAELFLHKLVSIDPLVGPAETDRFDVVCGIAPAGFCILEKHQNHIPGQTAVVVEHEQRRGQTGGERTAQNLLGFFHHIADLVGMADAFRDEQPVRFGETAPDMVHRCRIPGRLRSGLLLRMRRNSRSGGSCPSLRMIFCIQRRGGKIAVPFCQNAGFEPIAHGVADVGGRSGKRLRDFFRRDGFARVAEAPEQDFQL